MRNFILFLPVLGFIVWENHDETKKQLLAILWVCQGFWGVRGLSKKYPTMGWENKIPYLGGYNT
jgi:hypothetical protein